MLDQDRPMPTGQWACQSLPDHGPTGPVTACRTMGCPTPAGPRPSKACLLARLELGLARACWTKGWPEPARPRTDQCLQNQSMYAGPITRLEPAEPRAGRAG